MLKKSEFNFSSFSNERTIDLKVEKKKLLPFTAKHFFEYQSFLSVFPESVLVFDVKFGVRNEMDSKTNEIKKGKIEFNEKLKN